MKLITFDPLRSLGISQARYIKPDHMDEHRQELAEADALLFPEYWQINALAYGLGQRVFPSLATYHLGHDKIEQTRAFRACCPEATPDTAILGVNSQAIHDVEARFGYPFVAKRVRSAMGQGVCLIRSRQALIDYLSSENLLYAQRYLPIDRDLRIVVVGKRILAAYWRQSPLDDFRTNVAQGGEIRHDPVPDAALALVKRLSSRLGIDHAGFDIAMVEGRPMVLEFNRLFGNQGIDAPETTVPTAILEHLGAPSLPQAA
ncbi:hypothetical protein LCL99_08390 [Halomonas denitrificans]|uniref:ATP-grasp domain-containing protein n=1 Tax=Halomonas TaxID=2745 RepID=UPI001A8C6D07|nr:MULTISPECIES: hypothetical protein [Halomonas]MED5295811.1 hypothetical protein [Pseudomonadota bacterium]MBN8413852.1 hypothetical protein [Halomonas litopenaei]MBY5928530.1 hypothetical protein [Halomonas sp. DP8Y7-3]MBY5967700.1 hypothetical protein [Halomonas denitrificans]MBY6028657.1 hypothetical protein [Halomonas sp. DP8Y7-1]